MWAAGRIWDSQPTRQALGASVRTRLALRYHTIRPVPILGVSLKAPGVLELLGLEMEISSLSPPGSTSPSVIEIFVSSTSSPFFKGNI